jgi:hypothetical protein
MEGYYAADLSDTTKIVICGISLKAAQKVEQCAGERRIWLIDGKRFGGVSTHVYAHWKYGLCFDIERCERPVFDVEIIEDGE